MCCVRKSSVAECIVVAIEEKIITGVYLPGTRLDELSLANEFAASRTPVREALTRLHACGLIDIRPRRGAVVAEITPQRMFEMFEVMAGLEAMCAKLAARRHDDFEMQAIIAAQEACGRAEEVGDCNLYCIENERFHHAIYAASHNGFLHQYCTSLYRRLSAYRRLRLRVRDRLKNSRKKHVEVVEAIAQGNGVMAGDLMYEHVLAQGDFFSDLLASRYLPRN